MIKARKIGVTLLLACFLICGICFSPFGSLKSVKAEEQKQESIAVYVIAGQSNGAGYSLVSQVNSTYKNEHADGFKNVYYYGRSDSRYWTDFNTTVNFGLGFMTDRFGAEIGIAERHMAAYPNQKAIILKYAVGATYLVDTTNSVTSSRGNWTPPTFESSYNNGNNSGLLYRGLIDSFTKVIEHYKAENYAIDFKGTFWMQGEAETDSQDDIDLYENTLTAFISDLRNDYATILKDDTAKQSPFIIGKIAPTFKKANDDGGVGQIRKIQDAVASKTDRVYLVETTDYPMYDANGKNRGPDYYHFEGNDMVSLGTAVGQTFVTLGRPHIHVKVNGNGKTNASEYVFLDSDTKSITFTATKKHYVIGSVLYDGEDVTDSIVDGVFTITDTSGAHELTATFEAEPKYSIRIDADTNAVSMNKNLVSRGYYAGETLTFEIAPKSGYKIESVTFNGQTLEIKDGNYQITVVSGLNKLCVNAVAEEGNGSQNSSSGEQNGSNSSQSGSSGVSSSNSGGSCSSGASAEAMMSLLACLGSVLILKKFVI